MSGNKIKIFNFFKNQIEESEKIIKTDEEWKSLLLP